MKAYLTGSISNLDTLFVIGLEAVNARTGDTIARQQAEANSKEHVLFALGNVATKLREKLGESLTSIQKYDAPIYQATTSSLGRRLSVWTGPFGICLRCCSEHYSLSRDHRGGCA